MASPDVLKRLEEIGTRPADTYGTLDDCAEIGWLIRLTRALLDSQGELLELCEEEHVGREATARAERVRKGEV